MCAISIAVLTMYDGSHAYGKDTLKGIFARLLRGLPTGQRRPRGAAPPEADACGHYTRRPSTGRSAAWLARKLWVLEVPGSNPGAPFRGLHVCPGEMFTFGGDGRPCGGCRLASGARLVAWEWFAAGAGAGFVGVVAAIVVC